MQKTVVFLISLLAYPFVEDANAQLGCENVVVYSSGIWTDPVEADLTMRSMRIDARSYLASQGLDVPPHCFAVAPATPQGLQDLVESASLVGVEIARDAWQGLFGLGTLSAAIESLFTTRLAQFQPDPMTTEADIVEQLALYRPVVSSSQLILVAHSQGNLFANEAYRRLLQEGMPAARVTEVPIATPATETIKDVAHITLPGDVILWVAQLPANIGIAGTPCAPNTNDSRLRPLVNGVLCHGMATSYLLGAETKSAIYSRIAVAVTPPYIDPVALDDSYSMLEGDLLDPSGVSGILYNDTVPSNFVSVTYLNPPPGFSDNGGGRFTYTPPAGVVGLVQFSYSIHTTTTDSLPATVTIHVNPRPVVPVAVNDAYSVEQGGELRVTAPGVLANDTYPSGATVEFLSPLPPTLRAGNPDGSFTLDLSSDPTFVGRVSLQYVIHSVNGDSSVAAIVVDVTSRPAVARRLGWSVTPSGDIAAMQVPSWSQGVANFGWQFMMSRRATSANEWGATTCFGGAGGSYPVNLFQSPTDFISYNGGMNVFGMTGQDSLTRGGIGTAGCLVPGTYYFELSDLSSRQPDGGFTVNYFYEITFDGTVVSPVGDGVGAVLPVTIAPDGIVSFTCPADYVNVGYESLSGQYPDSSTPVSTNTLGPTLNCNALGASTYTMEGGFLNETRLTPDGDYWVRLSKYGTPFSGTAFNRDWIYWKARRQNGVWSVLP